jgi:hypothetical protein
MTNKVLSRHGVDDVPSYQRAILRQRHLTGTQKKAILATQQIGTYDRGSVSPLGGTAKPGVGFRAQPLLAVTDAVIKAQRR